MKIVLFGFSCLALGVGLLALSDPGPPIKEITNGVLHAKLYLPDVAHGFYHGTRFDWSGIIAHLDYKGHSYYGPWFDRTDPNVMDFIYDGPNIVAGPCSAIMGPVEEFSTKGTALGFDEAKPGATFIKIGVGILRKPDNAKYSGYRLYDIVDHGIWHVQAKPDSMTFTQELRDPSSGYGYIYRKVVRLVAGKPEMTLEHSLQNIGSKQIESRVYDHNFLVLDRQPSGPDFAITLPFTIQTDPPLEKNLAEVNNNQIFFKRVLTGEDKVYTTIRNFGNSADNYKIQIENKKQKTGIKVSGNRPLVHEALWSIRSVISVEPFIDMAILPGSEFTWQYKYEYY